MAAEQPVELNTPTQGHESFVLNWLKLLDFFQVLNDKDIFHVCKLHLLILINWQKPEIDSYQETLKGTYVPPHEVVLLSSVFVPNSDVNITPLLLIQVEIKLLSPLRVKGFGDSLNQQQKEIHYLWDNKKSKNTKTYLYIDIDNITLILHRSFL